MDPSQLLNNLSFLQLIVIFLYAIIYGTIGFIALIILGAILSLWLNWRNSKYKQSKPYITLAIEIPPGEIKSPKAVENIITQLFAIKSVFNFYDKWWSGQYTLQASLEIVGQDGYVQFVVHLPQKYQILFEKALYAQFPEIQVTQIADYTQEIQPKDLISENPQTGKYDMWGTEFTLPKPAYFPIRTYTLFTDMSGKEFSDPLASLWEMMSHLQRGERFWYQATIVPTKKDWQTPGMEAIKTIVEGKGLGSKKKQGPLWFFLEPIFHAFFEVLRVTLENISGSRASDVGMKKKVASQSANKIMTMVPPEYELIVKAIREKISRLGFITYVRVLYFGERDVFDSRQTTGDFQGIMRQFWNPQMNALSSNIKIEVDYPMFVFPNLRAKWRKKRLLRRAQKRYAGMGVDEPAHINLFRVEPKNIMSIEELATLWHFPLMDVADKSGIIRRVMSKKVHPRQRLPEQEQIQTKEIPAKLQIDQNITFFAQTNFRNLNRTFGLKSEDRRRHMYIIGKTGMGKSTLIQNMVYQDIIRGKGVAVIDPHGDLVDVIADSIPPERINDIIYFNPADKEYPIGFNILAEEDTEHRYLVASSLVGIFKKIWADSWGPRLEYLLRNSLLTLLETPGNTLLGVPRIFVDTVYRNKLVSQVNDPVVKTFWTNEYAKYNQNFQVEAISPIQNKIGQFITIPLIRNMIGQVKTRINFREIIDEKKIFLVNLAKGMIGEDVSSLLGATIISKLQIASMMRADVREEMREDFYLYIDEFQNFSTESFASILSEARKYRLNLIMAHQYIEQLDEVVAAAVFGNVGTFCAFGIGAEDATALEQEFMPEFEPTDLVNLGKYEMVLRLMINGATSRPFSAQTLAPFAPEGISSRDKVIKVSRERYAVSRDIIEDKIYRWHIPDTDQKQTVRPTTQKAREERGDNQRFGASRLGNNHQKIVFHRNKSQSQTRKDFRSYQNKPQHARFQSKEETQELRSGNRNQNLSHHAQRELNKGFENLDSFSQKGSQYSKTKYHRHFFQGKEINKQGIALKSQYAKGAHERESQFQSKTQGLERSSLVIQQKEKGHDVNTLRFREKENKINGSARGVHVSHFTTPDEGEKQGKEDSLQKNLRQGAKAADRQNQHVVQNQSMRGVDLKAIQKKIESLESELREMIRQNQNPLKTSQDRKEKNQSSNQRRRD